MSNRRKNTSHLQSQPNKRLNRSRSPASITGDGDGLKVAQLLPGATSTLRARAPPITGTKCRGSISVLVTGQTGHTPEGLSESNVDEPTPGPGPKCFRISNIPRDWEESDLIVALQNIDPSIQDYEY